MNTLLLRLSGAMQAWGVQSRFTVRDTGLEPSKSGVLGLICAAMGIPRTDTLTLQTLASLRMGVRVDREGILKKDYHTASNVRKASGSGLKDTEPSTRYYLADAVFLVGLESEDEHILKKIDHALINPVWPLYLGRKAFVPGESIRLEDGLRLGEDLKIALERYPLISSHSTTSRLRLVLEDTAGFLVRSDQPLSFAERLFAPRRLRIEFIEKKEK